MTVVNMNEFHKVFIDLGWDNLSPSEFAEWLDASGLPKDGVLAFCRDLLASPSGLDESTVVGLEPSQIPYVVEWFKAKGVVI